MATPTIDLEAILAELEVVERALADRIVVTRIIIDPDGHEVGRVIHGRFYAKEEERNL
jgi:hypothetical protein